MFDYFVYMLTCGASNCELLSYISHLRWIDGVCVASFYNKRVWEWGWTEPMNEIGENGYCSHATYGDDGKSAWYWKCVYIKRHPFFFFGGVAKPSGNVPMKGSSKRRSAFPSAQYMHSDSLWCIYSSYLIVFFNDRKQYNSTAFLSILSLLFNQPTTLATKWKLLTYGTQQIFSLWT